MNSRALSRGHTAILCAVTALFTLPGHAQTSANQSRVLLDAAAALVEEALPQAALSNLPLLARSASDLLERAGRSEAAISMLETAAARLEGAGETEAADRLRLARWALVAGQLATSVATVVLSYRMHPYRPRPGLAAASEYLRFGAHVLPIRLARYFSGRIGVIAVGRIASTAARALLAKEPIITMASSASSMR